MKKILPLLLISASSLFFIETGAQSPMINKDGNNYNKSKNIIPGKQPNFFVISRRKKGKLDLATRYNVLRTKLRAFFNHKKFIAVIAKNPEHMSNRLIYWLDKKKSAIGTIWFDSHGQYKKGYSLFTVGETEISYKTLKDSALITPFSKLSFYTTKLTKIIIGSCYGGATYKRLSIDYSDTTRMNGDSLMISLGHIMQEGIVYGSESWVMSKPGLFKRQPATGGNPGRKLFLDICYEPVWKNIGEWNQYIIAEKKFEAINTVALDRTGNLVIRGLPYVIEKKKEKDVQLKITKLEPGLYK